MAAILFIEDEEYEMLGVSRSLQQVHTIKQVATGADAVRELRLHHANYDLVILDLMLPRGNAVDTCDEVPKTTPKQKVGEWILDRMGTICPDMPTVVLTAVRTDTEGMRLADHITLFQKPVIMAQLLHRIDELLAASRSRS
jgi:CheY-like chemotaxis protein